MSTSNNSVGINLHGRFPHLFQSPRCCQFPFFQSFVALLPYVRLPIASDVLERVRCFFCPFKFTRGRLLLHNEAFDEAYKLAILDTTDPVQRLQTKAFLDICLRLSMGVVGSRYPSCNHKNWDT
jgi:hypothetical protein